jgi:hypothetical protein
MNGGNNPVWRRDGRELYYQSAEQRLVAVSVSAGATFDPGVPTPLFDLRVPAEVGRHYGRHYDVAPDGRFVVNTVLERLSPPLMVVVNWLTDVGKD